MGQCECVPYIFDLFCVVRHAGAGTWSTTGRRTDCGFDALHRESPHQPWSLCLSHVGTGMVLDGCTCRSDGKARMFELGRREGTRRSGKLLRHARRRIVGHWPCRMPAMIQSSPRGSVNRSSADAGRRTGFCCGDAVGELTFFPQNNSRIIMEASAAGVKGWARSGSVTRRDFGPGLLGAGAGGAPPTGPWGGTHGGSTRGYRHRPAQPNRHSSTAQHSIAQHSTARQQHNRARQQSPLPPYT